MGNFASSIKTPIPWPSMHPVDYFEANPRQHNHFISKIFQLYFKEVNILLFLIDLLAKIKISCLLKEQKI